MNIALSWNEFPAYGAKLVREGIKQLGFPVVIVATRPTVPITGMDAIVGQKIYWIKKDGQISWRDLGIEVPNVFFQAGW
jgi:hypothetical protein